MGVAALGRLLLDELLAASWGRWRPFCFGLDVLDHMGWRLGPDVADVVEALAAGSAGDLLELTDLERAGAHAVVLAEL